MKLFTSYFANQRNFPIGSVPIAICAKAPDWFNGPCYKSLAPKYETLMNYKNGGSWSDYVKDFKETVLYCRNIKDIMTDLEDIVHTQTTEDDPVVLLLCYEKPSDPCHRHLVANWFYDNGVECTEYGM